MNHKARIISYNLCFVLFLFFFCLFMLQDFPYSQSLLNDWKLLLKGKTLDIIDSSLSSNATHGSFKSPNLVTTQNPNLVTTQNPNLDTTQNPNLGPTQNHDEELELTASNRTSNLEEAIDSPNLEEGHHDSSCQDYQNCSPHKHHQSGSVGEKSREFQAFGLGSHLFIHMSTYRGGPDRFFINGLGSKASHVFSNASFKCEWVPETPPRDWTYKPNTNVENLTHGHGHGHASVQQGIATKMLPDWGFGRIYTVVIVMCTFNQDIGTDREGGKLVLYASPTDSFDDYDDRDESPNVQRIVALEEKKGEYNATTFDNPSRPYDYMYCGSPLFGDLNPQRIREWVSYHMKLFGPRSHFVLYDAGGIHPGVRKVLEPWVEARRITIENVRAQEKYDGYYHNQFLIVNDCLHKTRFMTNWTFFFDVDEFLYLPEDSSLELLLAEHAEFTQIFFEQAPMSHHLCINNVPSTNYSYMWGFEKLVFKSTKKGVRRDRKYAIQPRNVFATGVHLSQNLKGKSLQIRGDKVRYYHYHGTTSFNDEVCRDFINITLDHKDTIWFDKEPFNLDLSMHNLASTIKEFEIEQIGEQ